MTASSTGSPLIFANGMVPLVICNASSSCCNFACHSGCRVNSQKRYDKLILVVSLQQYND